MESRRHGMLKEAGARYLLAQGCPAVATEVRCPRGRFRADLAGYRDRAPLPTERTLWDSPPARAVTTFILECKASRADFLRDAADLGELLSRREALDVRRLALQLEAIPHAEPHLRRSGTALFQELEQWDFARSRLPEYRRVIKAIEAVDEALYGDTKFSRMARYRVADRLYVLAPRGVIRPRELPIGWGLLVHEPRGAEPVSIQAEAPGLSADDRARSQLLKNIAVSASRALWGGNQNVAIEG